MRMRASGFTLIEALVTVAILGVVAGMVVLIVSGAQQGAEERAIRAELVEIRKACQRFASDMGGPPRYLAELLQSPDSSDPLGGWWWRDPADPPIPLRAFDPAVGRGWNGPYLPVEMVSEGAEEAAETRTLDASGGQKSAQSDNAAGRRLALLCSDYATRPQKKDGHVTWSHFQLDFSDPGEIAVLFVHDPLQPASGANIVARLGLGLKP